MKLFLVLGNQLFNPKYLKEYSAYTFYMSEDYDLCTFQKHHKLKILLFLSSMRSYRDELREKGIKVTGELTLSWDKLKHIPWVGITGTNGKTTVTSLLYHVLNH